MSQTAVKLINVTKKIGDRAIVDGLNLDIKKGEVFGLLGPNGAGKTTTIRMMVGLISISAGEIFIHNKSVVKEYTSAIRHVGAIVENPELYRFMTGYENLRQYANMYSGISSERLDEVISLVGLEKRIHDKVKTYSLGMRQRLGVAQAILHNPAVLILDEPTNGLDPAGIRELRQYLRQLARKEGVTVIVSSHLLAEMELMCDRIAIIHHGKLIDVQSINQTSKNADSLVTVLFEVNNIELARQAMNNKFPELELRCENGTIAVAADRESTAEINACLVEAGVKVFGIKQKNATLEDKFMELTSGGDGIA